MAQTDQNTSARSPLWMRWALGLSLALNLLVVGLAVGAAFRIGDVRMLRPPPPSASNAMFRELPRKARKQFTEDVRAAEGLRPIRRRDEADEIAAAMRAVPFDAARMGAVLEGYASARQAWQQAINRAWVARLSDMTDAERASLSDRMQSWSKRRSERHKSRQDGARD